MNDIVSRFNENDSRFAYKAVQEARKNKGKINEILLKEVIDVGNNIGKEDYYAPISFDYSVFLLAEFLDKKLFAELIKLFSKPNIDFWEYIGSGVMDRLDNIIVSVFDGDYDSINKIIENKEIDNFARDRFLNCYIYFYNNGMISQEDLINYLRKIINLYGDKYDNIFDTIIEVIISTHLFDMINDVKDLYSKDLIDIGMTGNFDDFIDDIFNYEYNKKGVYPVVSIEKEMAWWACFNEENNKESFDEKKMVNMFSDFIKNDLQTNLVNPYKNVGRNDSCPCGSGKKYKKCCIYKEKEIKNTTLPYQNYITSSLEKYPKKKTTDEQLDIYDFYKDEYIDIDKLLYKVLKHKQIPMWIKRNYELEREIDLIALEQAYVLIKNVIEKENINSVIEYDNKVGIHYRFYDFFDKYSEIILDNIKDGINILENRKKLNELIDWTSEIIKGDKSFYNLISQMKKELKKI